MIESLVSREPGEVRVIFILGLRGYILVGQRMPRSPRPVRSTVPTQ